MTPRPSAFGRLRRLLDGIATPAGLRPIDLHLGESRLASPPVDLAPLAERDGWRRYPTPGGPPALRAAYTGWLERRFGVRRGVRDGSIGVEPTPGTKQAVTVAVALATARRAGRPAVVMPNPYYPTYRAAAEAVGARPVFYTTEPERGADPVLRAIGAAGADVTAVILCNPGNPRGEVLPADTLVRVAKATASAGALLIVDECYTDLALGAPPVGHLSLVENGAVEPGGVVVLHSLSKRSGAPGLRSGFLAGTPSLVDAYAAYNRSGGVSTPLPVAEVAAALWADDAHVARAGEALARNWALADASLGAVPGYARADAGFFLWLPVGDPWLPVGDRRLPVDNRWLPAGDDEEIARRLWRDHALSVMPGRYLADPAADGVNPGAGHLRIALVHDEEPMREALDRLRRALTATARAVPATGARRRADTTAAPTLAALSPVALSPVVIAQRLIRFDTVNPPGDEAACVLWIRDLLDGAGIHTRVLAADPRRPNLVARLPGRGIAPPLLLYAHVDVVPTTGQPWTRPPLGGEIIDGELWGRGAVDMKGQLAMMLAAMLRLRAEGVRPAGDVVLAVVPDEEAGSAVGARFLVERHPELFEGVRHAVGEDGGAELGLAGHRRLHPVVVAEKRTCWVRATMRGTAGHGSRVVGAGGAVPKLTALLTAIADGGFGVRLVPAVDRMLRELAEALPPPAGARVADFRADPANPEALQGFDEITVQYLRSIVRHTVSATVLRGGTVTNVHPPEVSVELDGRLLPGAFSADEFIADLRSRVPFELEIETLVKGEPVPEPRLDGFYDRLVEVLRTHDPGGVPLPTVTPASTDARLFAQLGIQCFGWMPLLHGADVTYRNLLHCADERIGTAALQFGADCFHSLLSGT